MQGSCGRHQHDQVSQGQHVSSQHRQERHEQGRTGADAEELGGGGGSVGLGDAHVDVGQDEHGEVGVGEDVHVAHVDLVRQLLQRASALLLRDTRTHAQGLVPASGNVPDSREMLTRGSESRGMFYEMQTIFMGKNYILNIRGCLVSEVTVTEGGESNGNIACFAEKATLAIYIVF